LKRRGPLVGPKTVQEDRFFHAPRLDPLRSALAKLDLTTAATRVWACGLTRAPLRRCSGSAWLVKAGAR
jgi:hypothetical protein